MLIPDWKRVLTKAWSVKFLGLSAVVSGCEAVMQISGTSFLPAGVGPAAIVGVITALALVARILAQNEAKDDQE